jgi:hypothetical protein
VAAPSWPVQVTTESANTYLLWVTSDGTEGRHTLPYFFAKSKPLTLHATDSGVAMCIMKWMPVAPPGKNAQLIVVETVYLNIGRKPHNVMSADATHIKIAGCFVDKTGVVNTAIKGFADESTTAVAGLCAGIKGRAVGIDGTYIFGAHKDPWFTTQQSQFGYKTVRWTPVPSSCGYPCLRSTTVSNAIWGRAVAMALVLLHQKPTFQLTDSVAGEQMATITICALTCFAGMYNATAETTDDRKMGFQSLGTNGDCDDMSIVCASVANYLIRSDPPPGRGLAAACWRWIKASCSKAVICLGYAVGKVVVPPHSRVTVGDMVPNTIEVDVSTGGGHCWAALVNKDADPTTPLKGCWLVEGTRQTFNHKQDRNTGLHAEALLRKMHLLPDPYTPNNIHDVYRPEGGNTHTVKPLRAEQYVSVLYVVDAASQCIVGTPTGTEKMLGASWADAVAGNVFYLNVPPIDGFYANLERMHKVPLTNLFSFDVMEQLWETDGPALEKFMYGDLLSKESGLLAGANFSGLSHAPGNATYQLTGPVMFGVTFG